MDLLWFLLHLLAGVISLSAVIAVVTGKTSRPAASFLVVIAGLAPWIFLVPGIQGLLQFYVLFIIGAFGSAPLFMGGLLVFGFRKRPEKWRSLVAACTVGVCAGIGYSVLLYAMLRKML